MSEVDKYLELYEKPTDELVEMAYKVTRKNFKRTVEFCSIISAKTGACSEDCKYCSQSAKSKAEIEIHTMLDVETVKKAALSAKENGATRFGIVTSGKKLSKKDFETLLEMVREVSKIENMQVCACTGILSEEEMKKLKEAGCTRYNHNINTSKEYYPEICTTHTFEDRIKTIKLADKVGMENCTGVIIGMGENRADRINMALTLRELKPKSTPINFLDPIKGTALESFGDKIDEEEILKTICIFRLILPDVYLRYAGGRMTRFSKKMQKLGLFAGINGLIVGNYLTTVGANVKDDLKMLEALGLEKE